jgi:hypothetical protein
MARRQMEWDNRQMVIGACLLGLGFIGGLIVLALISRAGDGYEDDRGFHAGRPPGGPPRHPEPKNCGAIEPAAAPSDPRHPQVQADQVAQRTRSSHRTLAR